MIAVGGQGGLNADVPRLGRHADGLAGDSIQQTTLGPGGRRLAEGLRERANLGDVVDQEQPFA